MVSAKHFLIAVDDTKDALFAMEYALSHEVHETDIVTILYLIGATKEDLAAHPEVPEGAYELAAARPLFQAFHDNAAVQQSEYIVTTLVGDAKARGIKDANIKVVFDLSLNNIDVACKAIMSHAASANNVSKIVVGMHKLAAEQHSMFDAITGRAQDHYIEKHFPNHQIPVEICKRPEGWASKHFFRTTAVMLGGESLVH